MEISLEGINEGHHNVTYRGIKCTKCPFDYVLYQMLIYNLKPDLIIEIGANEGGSALYFADLLQNISHKGVIHTIDIEDRLVQEVKDHQQIRFFGDGWEQYDISLAHGYNTVLVIEDSSHAYTNTLGVLEKFAPLVTSGSYFIVEDGIVTDLGMDEMFGGGPVKAIKEFLTENGDFEPDNYWLDFFGKSATFNTIGYLKRS